MARFVGLRKGGSFLSVVPLSEFVPSETISGKQHILLVVDQFGRVLGGGERVLLRTAELLAGAGYRVSILTFAIDPDCVALENTPCPVYLLPLTSVADANAFRSALLMGRFLRRERVDVVQTYFESSNLFGGIVTRALSRAKLIWNFRDMGILRERKHRLAYRVLGWMPHWVFTVSEGVRRHAIEVDGIAPERVSVVYNGLDLERWTRVGDRPDNDALGAEGATILTLGNIRAVKGHDVLVEAAARVLQRFPETRFLVAGEVLEPEFFSYLQSRLVELGIADRFDFLGGVTDLPSLFQRADVFVLPSRSEGFSNAIIEAMAAGLPVVATSVGGNAEAVADGETGIIVPPEDPEALASGLVDLLTDPLRMRVLGRKGRTRAWEFFTESSMLRSMERVYHQWGR